MVPERRAVSHVERGPILRRSAALVTSGFSAIGLTAQQPRFLRLKLFLGDDAPVQQVGKLNQLVRRCSGAVGGWRLIGRSNNGRLDKTRESPGLLDHLVECGLEALCQFLGPGMVCPTSHPDIRQRLLLLTRQSL